MSWYTLDEAVNFPVVPGEWADRVVAGTGQVLQKIAEIASRGTKSGDRPVVILDGYLGVAWDSITTGIIRLLASQGISVQSVDASSCWKTVESVETMVSPCLNADPYFGRVFDGTLLCFFDRARLASVRRQIRRWNRGGRNSCDVVIVYGCGADLLTTGCSNRMLFYFDVCREQVIKHVEQKKVWPIASEEGSLSAKIPFKRLYYVDFGVLNRHKKRVLGRMQYYVDANDPADLKLLPRDIFDSLIELMTEHPLRLRPIYIPGVWGGQEMKRIRGLPQSMVNCAFALELIPQEQSVRVAIGRTIVEMPFVNLVWREPTKLMGETAARKFGDYFPITLNYDDTSQGGHLAIQVHPHGKYLREKFNERIRRDESYYCVATWNGARTYHGIKTQTDLSELRWLCERAEEDGVPFDHDNYINSWPSKPGDLFLIPAGTVHASGRNQLVLEIDSDPSRNSAEYTFHLYDYLRPDLNGSRRAIHIDHAFRVIKPFRRTNWVGKNLRQEPRLVREGEGWAEYLLGRRPEMYYEVRRLEFAREIEDNTDGFFHVLTLVEGENVRVRAAGRPERNMVVRFTETVLVPANLGRYVIENLGESGCKMTKALLKADG